MALTSKTYTVYLQVSGNDEDAMDEWVMSGRWLDGAGSQGDPKLHHRGDVSSFDGWESGESWAYDAEGNEILPEPLPATTVCGRCGSPATKNGLCGKCGLLFG